MNSFRQYLEKMAYTPSTVDSYESGAGHFLKWCKLNNYNPEVIGYSDCKKYIQHLKSKKKNCGGLLSEKSVYHQIGIIKVYFKYLVSEDLRVASPLEESNIKGLKRGYDHNLLNAEELHELYTCFPTLEIQLPNCKSVAIRNKVLVGLAVFQGLDAKSLKTLEVEHIHLKTGKIYVPGSRRTESRRIRLKTCQREHLMQYLSEDREILQSRINGAASALFPIKQGRISTIVTQAVKRLKTINLKVTNLQQIRASVITIWVIQENLREAQYRAGHRYISTTEKYKKNDLNAMRDGIVKFHPFG